MTPERTRMPFANQERWAELCIACRRGKDGPRRLTRSCTTLDSTAATYHPSGTLRRDRPWGRGGSKSNDTCIPTRSNCKKQTCVNISQWSSTFSWNFVKFQENSSTSMRGKTNSFCQTFAHSCEICWEIYQTLWQNLQNLGIGSAQK